MPRNKGKDKEVINHYIEIKDGESISNLSFRFVHTTSYEFGSNIVGMVVTLSSGRVAKWDALQYPTHSQYCYSLDLNDARIIGLKGDFNTTTHPMMTGL